MRPSTATPRGGVFFSETNDPFVEAVCPGPATPRGGVFVVLEKNLFDCVHLTQSIVPNLDEKNSQIILL